MRQRTVRGNPVTETSSRRTVRLLLASSLFTALLGLLLLMPTLASAHTAAGPSPVTPGPLHWTTQVIPPGQLAQLPTRPYGYQPDPCLDVLLANIGGGYANQGYFNFHVANLCPWKVVRINAWWDLTSFCSDYGSGDASSAFPVPDLNPGQQESTMLTFSSYCVQCSKGHIVGYPPFSIDVAITQVKGYDENNPSLPADMMASGKHEDTAALSNSAHDSGGIRCP